MTLMRDANAGRPPISIRVPLDCVPSQYASLDCVPPQFASPWIRVSLKSLIAPHSRPSSPSLSSSLPHTHTTKSPHPPPSCAMSVCCVCRVSNHVQECLERSEYQHSLSMTASSEASPQHRHQTQAGKEASTQHQRGLNSTSKRPQLNIKEASTQHQRGLNSTSTSGRPRVAVNIDTGKPRVAERQWGQEALGCTRPLLHLSWCLASVTATCLLHVRPLHAANCWICKRDPKA
jgi:hypothetical protein